MLPPDVQSFTNFSIGIRDKDSEPSGARSGDQAEGT